MGHKARFGACFFRSYPLLVASRGWQRPSLYQRSIIACWPSNQRAGQKTLLFWQVEIETAQNKHWHLPLRRAQRAEDSKQITKRQRGEMIQGSTHARRRAFRSEEDRSSDDDESATSLRTVAAAWILRVGDRVKSWANIAGLARGRAGVWTVGFITVGGPAVIRPAWSCTTTTCCVALSLDMLSACKQCVLIRSYKKLCVPLGQRCDVNDLATRASTFLQRSFLFVKKNKFWEWDIDLILFTFSELQNEVNFRRILPTQVLVIRNDLGTYYV